MAEHDELAERERRIAEREKELAQLEGVVTGFDDSLKETQRDQWREEALKRFPAIQEFRSDFQPRDSERETLKAAEELSKSLEPAYLKLQRVRASEAYGSAQIGGGPSLPPSDELSEFASDFNNA